MVSGGPATTGYTILGVLSFGRELSGYDVKKWADASLKFFFLSPALSQIYSELQRLERLGLVKSRVVSRDEVRGKRVYRITREGRRSLTSWVNTEDVEAPALKHSVVLRVWLGHLAAPERLRTILNEHVKASDALAAEALDDQKQTSDEADYAFPHAVLRWAHDYYKSEARLARRLLAALPEQGAPH